jgi:ATP-dependent helicase HrpB
MTTAPVVPHVPLRCSLRDLPIYELEDAIVRFVRRTAAADPAGADRLRQIDAGAADSAQPRRARHRRSGDPAAAPVSRSTARHARRERSATGRLGRRSRLSDSASRIVVSQRTRIRFVTEGILLRQLIRDPELRGVSAILFDEFHERHLYGDITLARALRLQETTRPDLKIVVMSATLDTGSLDKFLEPVRGADLERTTSIRSPSSTCRNPVRADDYPIWDLAADELVQLAPGHRWRRADLHGGQV